ncbi:hypothetical protein CSOJ01_10346 [Colletotrichum sojae]|uniref:Uncharacterized protein n=1 Tax=Colletotrichum sojae TaxID=2175907 RepID=A0A8H6J0R4_9PEZI|nr:hypothetical protein CSOJ01_10346 [Colletotrichum sojae]
MEPESITDFRHPTADEGGQDGTARGSDNLFPSPSFFDPTMLENWWELHRMQPADPQGLLQLPMCFFGGGDEFGSDDPPGPFHFTASQVPDAQETLDLELWDRFSAVDFPGNISPLLAADDETQALLDMELMQEPPPSHSVERFLSCRDQDTASSDSPGTTSSSDGSSVSSHRSPWLLHDHKASRRKHRPQRPRGIKATTPWHSPQLPDQDQNVISNAWKSAYWIGVLFDWNRHEIFLDQYSSLRQEHPVNLQRLTIEFMHSNSYAGRRLMESLWRTVTGSLGKGKAAEHSFWTISYALPIMCSVTKNSKNSRLDAKDVPHLARFMSSLCSTTEPMLRALQQYRWEAARGCCWQDNPDQKLFDDLLKAANAMTSNLAISFEHQPGSEGFDSSFDSVFRMKPFLKEIDLLFAGKGNDSPESVGPATPSEIMSFWLSDHGDRGSEGVAADDTTEPDSLKVETGSQTTTARGHSKRKGAAIPAEDEQPLKTRRYLGELTDGGTCRVEVGATKEVEDFGAWQHATLHGLYLGIPGATIVGSVGPVAAANLQVQDCTDWKSLGGTMWDDLRGVEL